MKIQLNGEEVTLHKSNYLHNGANSLQAFHMTDMDGVPFEEPYATLSLNLVNEQLENDEIVIKTYSGNEKFLQQLIDHNVVSKPIRYAQSGYVTVPICKLLI